MTAAQFGGLSALVHLAEFEAGGTGFDDDCCLQLAQLTHLRTIRWAWVVTLPSAALLQWCAALLLEC